MNWDDDIIYHREVVLSVDVTFNRSISCWFQISSAGPSPGKSPRVVTSDPSDDYQDLMAAQMHWYSRPTQNELGDFVITGLYYLFCLKYKLDYVDFPPPPFQTRWASWVWQRFTNWGWWRSPTSWGSSHTSSSTPPASPRLTEWTRFWMKRRWGDHARLLEYHFCFGGLSYPGMVCWQQIIFRPKIIVN